MQSGLHKYIVDRASFVGGIGAWFRQAGDPKVRSAIVDVERFISTLPDDIDPPRISGGTTVSPEKIVTLYWLVGGHQTVLRR